MAETRTDAELKAAPDDSIEALYAAQESPLLLYAQRLVKGGETAQDIVQEAFMRLHAEFKTVKQPRAWLYRTVHNLALNHLRAGRKIVPLVQGESSDPSDPSGPSEPCDPQPLPDAQIERMEAVGQARMCLDALDGRRRELIRLKFEEGLSYKEISERMNLSITNVGYLLHQALKEMAAAFKKSGVVP